MPVHRGRRSGLLEAVQIPQKSGPPRLLEREGRVGRVAGEKPEIPRRYRFGGHDDHVGEFEGIDGLLRLFEELQYYELQEN